MKQKPMEPNESRTPLFPVEEMQEILDQETGCTTDMTGLIPANPQNEEDLENYSGLYPYLPPVIDPDQM